MCYLTIVNTYVIIVAISATERVTMRNTFDGYKSELRCWVFVLMAQFGLAEVEAIKTLGKAWPQEAEKPLETIDFSAPTEARIKYEYANEHQGWTDRAIMLNCGDRDTEREIEYLAMEMADLHTAKGHVNTVSLAEEIADFCNIYEVDEVVPKEVYRLVEELF